MFSMGHSAATARHFYETLFFEEDESEMQQKLADRSANPNVGDVNWLYKKWRQEQMGEDDGKELLENCNVKLRFTMRNGEKRVVEQY